MARYWPQSGEPQARPMNTVPKLAVSATLTERRPGATLAWQEGDLDREIRALKQQPGGPARPGPWAASAWPAMLGLRLAGQMRLMMFPELLGSGGNKAMFAGYAPTPLGLHGTKVLGSQIVVPESRPAM